MSPKKGRTNHWSMRCGILRANGKNWKDTLFLSNTLFARRSL